MKEPPEIIFFADRNLGKHFPQILKNKGIRVEVHDAHFDITTPDEEWLSEVGKRGWYVITYDRRIRYKPNEIEAVKEHAVGLFVLIGKARFDELALNFINTHSKIEKFASRHTRPFIAKIYRPGQTSRFHKPVKSGRVVMWVSFQE